MDRRDGTDPAQSELHSWGPSPSRSRSRGRSATSLCSPSRQETLLLPGTESNLRRGWMEKENSQHLISALYYIKNVIRWTLTQRPSPDTTSPCLLTAKGRHARFFHWFVTGSKLSTLRSTTLSSSPPTVTITSAVPVAMETIGRRAE